MTTYPLSELATLYAVEAPDDATSDVLGRGTLEECADIVADLSPDRQKTVSIRMDNLDLTFGPQKIGELLEFLRSEDEGLSNTQITDIKTSGS